MKSKTINTLKLNSVSISNLASVKAGLRANNAPVRPVSPLSANCHYSSDCQKDS